jgi:hypothetical protein
VATASESSAAPVPPLGVGARSLDGDRPANWATGNPRWPAWLASAARCCAGERGGVGDLLGAKVGLDEGLSAKALTPGIERLVVVLFAASAGAFLQKHARARRLPHVGCLACVGRVAWVVRGGLRW